MCKMNEDMNLTKLGAEAVCPQYYTEFKCNCSQLQQIHQMCKPEQVYLTSLNFSSQKYILIGNSVTLFSHGEGGRKGEGEGAGEGPKLIGEKKKKQKKKRYPNWQSFTFQMSRKKTGDIP